MTEKEGDFKDTWTDPDEAPELSDDWFEAADLYDGGELVSRGAGQGKTAIKEAVSLRLDRDVLAYFRATGRGWQSRINAALRKAAGF